MALAIKAPVKALAVTNTILLAATMRVQMVTLAAAFTTLAAVLAAPILVAVAAARGTAAAAALVAVVAAALVPTVLAAPVMPNHEPTTSVVATVKLHRPSAHPQSRVAILYVIAPPIAPTPIANMRFTMDGSVLLLTGVIWVRLGESIKENGNVFSALTKLGMQAVINPQAKNRPSTLLFVCACKYITDLTPVGQNTAATMAAAVVKFQYVLVLLDE